MFVVNGRLERSNYVVVPGKLVGFYYKLPRKGILQEAKDSR